MIALNYLSTLTGEFHPDRSRSFCHSPLSHAEGALAPNHPDALIYVTVQVIAPRTLAGDCPPKRIVFTCQHQWRERITVAAQGVPHGQQSKVNSHPGMLLILANPP